MSEGPYKVVPAVTIDGRFVVQGPVGHVGCMPGTEEESAKTFNSIHAAALASLSAGAVDLTQFEGMTPGEWLWQSFDGGKTLFLGTRAMGRLIVMDFVRKGMSFACPRFSDRNGESRGGIMHPHDMTTIDHNPDARAIAAVPKLIAEVKALRARVAEKDEALRTLAYEPHGTHAVADIARAALSPTEKKG